MSDMSLTFRTSQPPIGTLNDRAPKNILCIFVTEPVSHALMSLLKVSAPSCLNEHSREQNRYDMSFTPDVSHAGYVPRHYLVAADGERVQAAPAAPTPEFYWEARRDAEGADAPDGGALARARALRAFAMEEPPEMDLAEGDELLDLVEEHADEAQGWIFAAKAAEAG